MDTSPDVRVRQLDRWRTMRPEDKAALVDRLSNDVTAMALAGIRREHPEDRIDEVLELVARRYGRTMKNEVHGRAE